MIEDDGPWPLIYTDSAAGFGFLRQWIVEFNITDQRLRIRQRWLFRRLSVVADCPFDECLAVGTIEYQNEGGPAFGAYVQLKNGKLHAIPCSNSSFQDAARIAKDVSTATGIPRSDTRYP